MHTVLLVRSRDILFVKFVEAFLYSEGRHCSNVLYGINCNLKQSYYANYRYM